MQPRRFGGLQASFGLFSRIIEILAEGCAASAWVYAVLGEHQWIIACMPEQAQEDVWGDDSARRRLVVAGAQGNGAGDAGRLAAERAVSVLLRLPARAMGDHRRALRGCGGQSRRPVTCSFRCRRSKSSTTGRYWDCAAPAAGRCCSTTSSCPRTAASCCAIFMTARRRAPWCIRITRCCERRAVCWCRSRCRCVAFTLARRALDLVAEFVAHPPVARHPRHGRIRGRATATGRGGGRNRNRRADHARAPGGDPGARRLRRRHPAGAW